MNLFKRYRAETVLFWGVSLFIIVLLMNVSLVTTKLVSNAMVEKSSHYQMRLIEEISNNTVNSIRNIEHISFSIAHTFEESYYRYREGNAYEKNKTQNELYRSLSNSINTNGFLYSIELYMNEPMNSRDDYVKFATFDQLPSEDWMESISSSDSAWLASHSVEINKNKVDVITYARKIYSSKNQYIGLLLMHSDLSVWESSITSKDVYTSRAMLDTGQRLLVGTETAHFKSFDLLPFFSLFQKHGSGFEEVKIENKKYVMVWTVTNDKWILVELTPWKEVVGDISQIKRYIWSIGFISLIITVFMIKYYISQFMKPIRRLTKLMGTYPLNQNQNNVPLDYQNEFGSLFTGYRKLTERIQELYEGLELQYKKQKEVEVKALQTMINPHFLYNTLDQINWKAIESEQQDVSQMLSHLGKMLRITLSDGKGLITVEQEIDYIQNYLLLQKIRWGDALQISIIMDPEVRYYLIPKMTIQPIVENSFRHGFHGKKEAKLEIIVTELHDEIEIIIMDNGVGLKENWWVINPALGGGYALRNVNERLQHYYHSDLEFKLTNRDNSGVKTYIRIPKLSDSSSI